MLSPVIHNYAMELFWYKLTMKGVWRNMHPYIKYIKKHLYTYVDDTSHNKLPFRHQDKWINISVNEKNKKFSAPVLWEWPRAENVPLFLNIIFFCLDALSPTLFQFVYPFKIEAFFLAPQVLINSPCNAFIASKFLPRRLFFRFGNRSPKGLTL